MYPQTDEIVFVIYLHFLALMKLIIAGPFPEEKAAEGK